jgi:ATP-dependent helicase HrpB
MMRRRLPRVSSSTPPHATTIPFFVTTRIVRVFNRLAPGPDTRRGTVAWAAQLDTITLKTVLPIDPLLPSIVASLETHPNLVIEAAPGAGKTTRVPPALLQGQGSILVLEPRRIAARLAGRRVAGELGEPIGRTVGYQVRFEEIAGPETRLRFLTEGVLTRRMISDPELHGVSTVILDEFHERHLETDLALALLRRLQGTKRPDLRLIVMSATLDAAPVQRFLKDAPLVRSEGRLFPLEIEFTPYSAAPLEDQVAAAAERLLAANNSGDILAFLPGAAEIRRAMRACQLLARRFDLAIAPLYGDLSPAEQDAAVEPGPRRKLILSTNIAESSITIEDVRFVIDSGLARVASDSPWTGLPRLEIKRISKASARQRAGRAARTARGRVVRLYTAEDFHRRLDHDAPEISRRELSQMCLQLEAARVHDPLELEWLDAPPRAAIDAAEALLTRLRARGSEAHRMSRLPLHPRLARLVLEAGEKGARMAALLSSGQRVASTDLLHAMDEPQDGRTKAVYDQIRRFAPSRAVQEISRAVLVAFPDRVGRRRSAGTVALSNGISAAMTNPPGEFLVAVDIEERPDRGLPEVRLACPIEPESLIDVFPERVIERTEIEWNRQSERVEAVSAILYDELVIDETRGAQLDDEAAARILARKAGETGIGRFVDRDELESLIARSEFAAAHGAVAAITEADVDRALETLCYGLRSFGDLERAGVGLIPLLEKDRQPLLDRIAPSRIRLPQGRQVKVRYERDKPPWIASRLQDFFGMTETPRLARGAVPVVVHLLAPNHRPVQMTTDLAGFWQRLYPQLRRELGRRYPKHAWPEQPV